MTDSPAPGTPQTSAKANVAGVIAALATFAAPYVVTEASKYLDPAWVASCLNASSLSLLAGSGMALVAGGVAWAGTHLKANAPKT